MTDCGSTIPWPCGSPTTGTPGLGSVLCARHLAAILAPLVPPALDRVALRKHHVASTVAQAGRDSSQDRKLEPELIDAIVALVPLGATIYAPREWYPSCAPRDARMPVGASGDRFRITGADDPVLPAAARSTMHGAIHGFPARRATKTQMARAATPGGWDVRATIVDDLIAEHVLIKCQRDGELLTFTWTNNAFAGAWRRSTFEPLGLRAAQALL